MVDTRKENPISVTFRDKTTRVLHEVAHHAWDTNENAKVIEDSFMNRYAVSPIPASNAPGSDFAGQVATLEWEENFPYTGEYVFRGMADNVGKLYLDNELIINKSVLKLLLSSIFYSSYILYFESI